MHVRLAQYRTRDIIKCCSRMFSFLFAKKGFWTAAIKSNQSKQQYIECVIKLSLKRRRTHVCAHIHYLMIGRSDLDFCGASIMCCPAIAIDARKISLEKVERPQATEWPMCVRIDSVCQLNVWLLSFLLLSLSLGVTIDIVVGQRPAHSRIATILSFFFFGRCEYRDSTRLLDRRCWFSANGVKRNEWQTLSGYCQTSAWLTKWKWKERAREKVDSFAHENSISTRYEFYFSTLANYTSTFTFFFACLHNFTFFPLSSEWKKKKKEKKNAQQMQSFGCIWHFCVSCPLVLVSISHYSQLNYLRPNRAARGEWQKIFLVKCKSQTINLYISFNHFHVNKRNTRLISQRERRMSLSWAFGLAGAKRKTVMFDGYVHLAMKGAHASNVIAPLRRTQPAVHCAGNEWCDNATKWLSFTRDGFNEFMPIIISRCDF